MLYANGNICKTSSVYAKFTNVLYPYTFPSLFKVVDELEECHVPSLVFVSHINIKFKRAIILKEKNERINKTKKYV